MRPHLLVTAERLGNLRSLADLRAAIEDGHGKQLWQHILAEAKADLQREPWHPRSVFPGRGENHAERGNREYKLVHPVGQRIMRGALVALVTGDERYRDASLRQIECVFDEERWPDWRDLAHLRHPADLRTGQLARAIGLAYDWMHGQLTAGQRRMIVEGLDRRAIKPFWESVERGIWWTHGSNNWTTCIVGGLGTAGMALAEDHPDGERLVEYSLEQMENYLGCLGPEGEFNESIGYSGAMRLPIWYFAALRYHTHGSDNRLNSPPFPEACRWIMHQTVPPGRTIPFGDASPNAPPPASAFSAVAAATRDPVLQWFYLQNADVRRYNDPVTALLTYDDRIRPESPRGKMPLGRAYEAFGAVISSRSAWQPWEPSGVRCAVHSKAGIEQNHQHHDAGQVVINGFGKRLIVDLGSPPGYAADFFSAHRWKYYNASSWGHNVLNLVGKEMSGSRNQQSPNVISAFDDEKGGAWRMDLTPFYDEAQSVTRAVIHLKPGFVVVLDEAEFDTEQQIRLRWHTIDRCEPDQAGQFTVTNDGVKLVSRVVQLDGDTLKLVRDQHSYEPPYNRSRIGTVYPQRNESFVEAQLTDRRCRLLSGFAVFGPDEETAAWQRTDDGLRLNTEDRAIAVSVNQDELVAVNELTGADWRLPLGGK